MKIELNEDLIQIIETAIRDTYPASVGCLAEVVYEALVAAAKAEGPPAGGEQDIAS